MQGERSGTMSKGTPTRPIRVALGLWDRFGEATERVGTDRSTALRAFMAWYIGEEGAKLPKRPGPIIRGDQ
jgi:hypothetical protein